MDYDQLQKKLKTEQRQILQLIWNEFTEKNEWSKCTSIHVKLKNKKITTEKLLYLKGLVVEQRFHPANIYYLTELGALCAQKNDRLLINLGSFIDYLNNRLLKEADLFEVEFSRIKSEVGIRKGEEKDFYSFIKEYNYFWSSFGGTPYTWSMKTSGDIDQVLNIGEGLPAFVKQRAMRHADLDMPVDIENRAKYLASTPYKDSSEKLCFVIMSFSGEAMLEDLYVHGIKATVEDIGFKCERVCDQQFNYRILDRIKENLRNARFVVADLSETRPNCYYEVGMAHAYGKEVILISRSLDEIHFDLKDYNFILYKGINDLKKELRSRIEETIVSQ